MTDPEQNPSSQRPRVDEVVARMVGARAELDGVLGRLSPEQLSTPGPEGWAIKDHLVHLEVWARATTDLLEGRLEYPRLGVADYAEFKASTIDGINTRIYEENRFRSLEDVLAGFRQSHERFVERVRAMSDADLQRPYRSFVPDERPDGDDPILDWIAADSYEHDEEHLGWIKEHFGLS